MITPTQGLELAGWAVHGGPADWRAGAEALGRLDGRSWLLLDQAVRRHSWDGPVQEWSDAELREPTGFVAAVTSMHFNGRLREYVTGVLAPCGTPVATAALAVRLLDHVPQVRERAWWAVRPRLCTDAADVALDVLLAGSERYVADAVLRDVRIALLEAGPAAAVVSRLIASARPRVRRWAYTLGHDQDVLSPAALVAAGREDPDQWVRAMCARWLASDPDQLAALLDAPYAEVRVVALAGVPDDALDDMTLDGLLTDKAFRVRATARWRAGRRGVDVLARYRATFDDPDNAPRVRAAGLEGLATLGDEADLPTCIAHLDHDVAHVREAAVTAVLARAPRTEAITCLTPLLYDPSRRVARAAARGLAGLGVSPSIVETAWASDDPTRRRIAWWLAHSAGGWARVDADLRAAADPDPDLASVGRTAIRNWIEAHSVRTWSQPTEQQSARIQRLLPLSGLDASRQRSVAFTAGIEPYCPPTDATPDTIPAEPARTRWPRLFRRRRR